MRERMPITIGDNAVEAFLAFCRENGYKKFHIIADENTAQVLGDRVVHAVRDAGWDTSYLVLDPEGLHTDGVSILRALDAYDAQPRLFVAVGSGTITDITRFSSHRSQNKFVSFPTAASVDAYTSKNAPVTVGKLKGSIYCHAPIAIFTDMQTIVESPKHMTASGFGDLASKGCSSTDWKITHIVWGLDFDEGIYDSGVHAGNSVTQVVEGIQNSDPEAMQVMMRSQFESGFTMADFGNSAPASGAEHHIAHIWEMMFHWDGREGLFHGHAVGVSAIMTAEWYKKLKTLSCAEAADILESTVIPTSEEQIKSIKKDIPQIALELIESNPIYLQLADPKKWEQTRQRILDNWDVILEVAQNVPDPDDMRRWIKMLGGPTTPAELGLSPEEVKIAKEYGHYLRERFSINILRKLFGWE